MPSMSKRKPKTTYSRSCKVSALKDTVPGDFPAMNLSEICELIQEHKSNGPVMEMKC